MGWHAVLVRVCELLQFEALHRPQCKFALAIAANLTPAIQQSLDPDPVFPLGPGPPATPLPAGDDGTAGGLPSPGGRGLAPHLRGSVSTPCMQPAEDSGWSSD